MQATDKGSGSPSIDPGFIEQALKVAPAAIFYAAGRALASATKGACIALGQDVDFHDLAYDGFCEVSKSDAAFSQFTTNWRRQSEVGEDFSAGMLDLRWRGKRFTAVRFGWTDMFDRRNAVWILGDEESATREFAAAVLDAANVPRHGILVFANGCFSTDRGLFAAAKEAEWSQLVLAGDLADRIRNEVSSFLGARELYAKYRVPYKRGILLIGPPGNGKTECVRLLIKEAGLPTIYVKNFTARYGEDDANIAAVFRRAHGLAPCLLVLEDVDSLVRPPVLSVFLNELDGLRSETGILTVATTNHPERLDPALLERPSRFDRKYHLPLPGKEERRRYLLLWNDRFEPAIRIDPKSVERIVAQTDSLSFAFLKELVVSSMMRWMSGDRRDPMGDVVLRELAALRSTWRAFDEGDMQTPESSGAPAKQRRARRKGSR